MGAKKINFLLIILSKYNLFERHCQQKKQEKLSLKSMLNEFKKRLIIHKKTPIFS